MADFDPTTPSIARVYDYLLDGKDNFAVDREVAQKLLAAAPGSADVMRENRQFLARATRWAAGQGITQFIDLGCGMPTVPNTHGSAQEVIAGPRVAYVDNDAVVLAHLRALAAHGNAGVTVVDSDVRDVAATLDAGQRRRRPVPPACLLMGARRTSSRPDPPATWFRLRGRPGAGQLPGPVRRPGRRRRGRPGLPRLLLRWQPVLQPLGRRLHRLLR